MENVEQAGSNPIPSLGKLRVLVADDNLEYVATTKALLELEGWEVLGVTNGNAVLSLFERFQPHVVLLDIGMPDLTGYDVARALRANARGQLVLIIAVSCYAGYTDRFAGKIAGFDHHLAKPADPSEMIALIKKHVDFSVLQPLRQDQLTR